MKRGDVILVRFPHPSGLRGKKRPAVIVQSDAYGGAVRTLVVAEVTKNLALAHDPACLFIDWNTPEGKATGLLQNSVVSGLLLATVDADRVANVLGSLSAALTRKLDDCLKVALGLPKTRGAIGKERASDCHSAFLIEWMGSSPPIGVARVSRAAAISFSNSFACVAGASVKRAR